MRFKLALLLLTLSCVPLAARADDASKLAKVQEFFKVSKMDQLSVQVMKQAMDQVNSGVMQQMLGVKLTPSQQQSVDDVTKRMQKIISGALNWKDLEPEYAKIYAAAYTEQQLDDILAFYKSPTGQAMVDKSPALAAQASAITQKRMEAVIPQLQQVMKDFITQLAAQKAAGKS